LIALVVVVSPFLQISTLFGFQPVPVKFILALIIIVVTYIVTAEVGKKIFYRRFAHEK
jgi:Mg2+-importing ATPase